jgi:hypothetical protein
MNLEPVYTNVVNLIIFEINRKEEFDHHFYDNRMIIN